MKTFWIGDSAELCKLTWKVTRSALPGKDIICRAKVKERIGSEHDELIASGEAKIAFIINSKLN